MIVFQTHTTNDCSESTKLQSGPQHSAKETIQVLFATAGVHLPVVTLNYAASNTAHTTRSALLAPKETFLWAMAYSGKSPGLLLRDLLPGGEREYDLSRFGFPLRGETDLE